MATASKPRSGERRSSRSLAASGRRFQGRDRDCPTSKNSATTVPPLGSMSSRARRSCQAREGGGVLLVLGRDPSVEGEGLHDLMLLPPPGSRADLRAIRAGSRVMLRGRAVISGFLPTPAPGLDQDLQHDPRRSRCEARWIAWYDHLKTVGVVRGPEPRACGLVPLMGWTSARLTGCSPP